MARLVLELRREPVRGRSERRLARALSRARVAGSTERCVCWLRWTSGSATCPTASFVDELALATQVVPKDEQLDWSHGYLLHAALASYLRRTPSDRPVTIFETGTARGFSAICMAQALRHAGRAGTILTVDILHAERPIYWNSIADADGRRTRLELLEPWAEPRRGSRRVSPRRRRDRARAARARADPLRVPRRRAHLRRCAPGAGLRRSASAARRRDRL